MFDQNKKNRNIVLTELATLLVRSAYQSESFFLADIESREKHPSSNYQTAKINNMHKSSLSKSRLQLLLSEIRKQFFSPTKRETSSSLFGYAAARGCSFYTFFVKNYIKPLDKSKNMTNFVPTELAALPTGTAYQGGSFYF
jgi:hypothetical protein